MPGSLAGSSLEHPTKSTAATDARIKLRLRLMELAGEVAYGYFFEGLSGPQFAARKALAEVRRDSGESFAWPAPAARAFQSHGLAIAAATVLGFALLD